MRLHFIHTGKSFGSTENSTEKSDAKLTVNVYLFAQMKVQNNEISLLFRVLLHSVGTFVESVADCTIITLA